MRFQSFLLIALGFLCCSSSLHDEEEKYSNKPPYRSLFLEGYSEESLRHYLDTAPIDSWEGIWLLTENGDKVGIERFNDKRFSAIFTHRIVKLKSSNGKIPVGTVIGYLSRGVQAENSFIWLYKYKWTGTVLYAPKKYSARLTGDLNGIVVIGKRLQSLDELLDPRSGFIKLYPTAAPNIENREIIYL